MENANHDLHKESNSLSSLKRRWLTFRIIPNKEGKVRSYKYILHTIIIYYDARHMPHTNKQAILRNEWLHLCIDVETEEHFLPTTIYLFMECFLKTM